MMNYNPFEDLSYMMKVVSRGQPNCPTCNDPARWGGEFGIMENGKHVSKGWRYSCPKGHEWEEGLVK